MVHHKIISCSEQNLKAWKLAAAEKGMSLDDWIVSGLNSKAFQVLALPTWVKGLSRTTAKTLMQNEFRNLNSVIKAVEAGFDFSTLDNMSAKQLNELKLWVSERSLERKEQVRQGMEELNKLFNN